MNFLTAYHTDVGLTKETNQDSICIKLAKTNIGNVLMAIICDGMGGLEKGELASATVIRRFCYWFDNELPMMLEDFKMDRVKYSFDNMISELNEKIAMYGKERSVSLGTTLTVMFFAQDEYMIAHVGDSRAYEISNNVIVLTEDQTVVGREVRRGRMTMEQAKTDPRRNVLLQCIGASSTVVPDYIKDTTKKGAVYMLCSDGFRHVISSEEMYMALNPNVCTSEDAIKMQALQLVELNKQRKERDNISVIVIKTGYDNE